MTEKSSEPDWSEPGLPGRFVARARRIADLSQRELAAAVGVSHGTIARIEAGKGHTSPTLLSAVLRIAGLRLAVIDEDGREVLPIPADTVRDNAGRRFPAHLDVAPPDGAPRDRFPNAPDRVRVPRRLLPRGGMPRRLLVPVRARRRGDRSPRRLSAPVDPPASAGRRRPERPSLPDSGAHLVELREEGEVKSAA